MVSAVSQYRKFSRRRYRLAARSHQRLDIQGLRMVAVLTVLASHLWDWPPGGFIGVDVFFVISGFLITGNLLRGAEAAGNVSFRTFYWNRIRRIVPAATVVLVLTYFASVAAFLPFRAHQVGVDAFFAFIFMSNWRFAIQNTDYFQAGAAVSPIRHYWSLSIEEQFYFVWPALIFVISVLVLHRAWTHRHRMVMSGAVMGLVVATSLGWSLYESRVSPTWAYFDTFARVWELGVGALLATAIGALTRIPRWVKPLVSWGGLALIAASLFLITADSVGFPAPWAIMPVAGAALVIVAGVGEEPKAQEFLRNPLSSYIGDISYSLYLVHWPVIVILGSFMKPSWRFSLITLLLVFGLAIASYHFVESPLRRADWRKLRSAIHEVRRRHFGVAPATKYAGLAAITLLTGAATTYALSTNRTPVSAPPSAVPAAATVGQRSPQLGPLTQQLRSEIDTALQATEWPPLTPTMEQAIAGPTAPDEVARCAGRDLLAAELCTYGSPDAPTQIMVVGSSIAVTYVTALREIALHSEGQIQVRNEAMFGCTFVHDLIKNMADDKVEDCQARNQHAVDVINDVKPDVVVIANGYGEKVSTDTGKRITPDEWIASMRKTIDEFSGSFGKLVMLSAPPADVDITECYANRSSAPPDCISKVPNQWDSIADAERDVAEIYKGVWVDSRSWFCSEAGLCPSFVGSTPAKKDRSHMTPEYAQKIAPAVNEIFSEKGIIPST